MKIDLIFGHFLDQPLLRSYAMAYENQGMILLRQV